MMSEQQVIEADLTWMNGAFHPAVRVVVDRGRIVAAGGASVVAETTTKRLERCALLPGMINAHSHAFQRGLRGSGEVFPDAAGSFWTWREAMYALVERMDEALMYRLSKQAFDEMLAAGITTVGEFHYLHHDGRGDNYALDDVVLRAARDAGIRIVLLQAYYHRGGIGRSLEGAQLRFRTASMESYWAQIEALSGRLDTQTQSLGVAAHSIRAADLGDVATLYNRAVERGMPFHMHVEEQRREIEECTAAFGDTPMSVLDDEIAFGPRFIAVHCTHTRPTDLDSFLEAGATVCICPLTEANLGDGVADVPHILDRRGRICLGTDSNARICFAEEMRWLEYAQRLRHERRGIVRDEAGRSASALWSIATVNGAHALGVDAGSIRSGRLADFVTIDLDHPALAGCDAETLLDGFIFGAGNEVVAATCVGGRWFEQGQPA